MNDSSVPITDPAFDKLVQDSISRWNPILTLRRISLATMPSIDQFIAATAMKDAGDLNAMEDLWLESSPKETRLRPEDLQLRILKYYKASVDAASLVFAHSILDDLTIDACAILLRLFPHEWASQVENDTVTLKDMKDFSYDELLKKKLENFSNALSRKSLMKRFEHINAICRPKIGRKRTEDREIGAFTFNPKRLATLDKLRHRIVHEGAIEVIDDLDEDLDYMFSSSLYLVKMIAGAFNLKLNRPQDTTS